MKRLAHYLSKPDLLRISSHLDHFNTKKSNYSISLIILVACLTAGCTKEEDNPFGQGNGNISGSGRFFISGRFLQDCGGAPIANTEFIFWQPGVGGGDVGKVTTAADGSFGLYYNPINGATLKYGRLNQYGYVEYGQMQVGNYKDIRLYGAPTCYLKVSMQVYNNSYTNQDTMLIGDFGKNGGNPILMKIPGPFMSGPLFDVPDYYILNYAYDGTFLPLITNINNLASPSYGNVKLTPCDTINYVVQIH